MGAGHQHRPPAESSGWRSLLVMAAVAGCLALSAAGLVRQLGGLPLNALAAVLGGLPILWGALGELRRGRLSADLAVCVAAGAALAIGEHFVAAEVVLIMLVGGWLEALAVSKTRHAVQALLRLVPPTATRLAAGQRERVSVDLLSAGDRIAVAPGERLAVDGLVAAGTSTVDHSALTGESLPADVGVGARVLAGSLNGAGPIEVVAERVGGDTAFGRMVHLVEAAEQNKAPSQRLADRYASYFLPVVLACAGGVYLWSGDVVRAVAVLVVACPCALVLATPTAVTAGIGRLARRGILVKGGAPLEALGRSSVLLLDKTGTLTLARLAVAEVIPAPGYDDAGLVRLAGAVEQYSEHPVGRAIVAAAAARHAEPLPVATAVTTRPGLGIAGTVAGQQVAVGSPAYLETLGVAVPAGFQARLEAVLTAGWSVVGVVCEHQFAGFIAVADQVRPEARGAVACLDQLFGGRLCMLTGDAAGPAQRLADGLGIRDVRSQLLPEDKTRIVAEFRAAGAVVAMVGDGVNDAAALAAADVGLVVTDVGTDVAVEVAGVALHGEPHLDKLCEAVVFARRVLRTMRQNLVLFAGVVNAGAVLAAGGGWVGPVAGAVLHQVSSLLVVGNSLRLLWDRRDLADGCHDAVRRGAAVLCRAGRPLSVMAVLAYVLSGVFAVGPGEVGVVRWFGCPRDLAGPGLHYRLPWPATRLDRMRPAQVERLEVGFCTNPAAGTAPASYEWNIQHRDGRYRTVPDESLTTCGDQRFLDVNVVLHIRPTDPVRYLFAAAERPRLLQALAVGAIGDVLSRRAALDVLTVERSAIEAEILGAAQAAAQRLDLGVEVCSVHLQDVHPPLDLVDAYRRAVDAMEEKDATVERAEAYALEQVPLARGQAALALATAHGQRAESTARAQGDAALFLARVEGRGNAPATQSVVDFRFYAEAMEGALQGRRVVVVDGSTPERTGLVLVPPGLVSAPSRRAALAETLSADPPEAPAAPANQRQEEP